MTKTVRLETLLKPRAVAELADVSPRTVVRWIHEGKLKGVKVGRVWRVRARDWARFNGEL
jgi:excisionase family DNA binding protein